MSPLDASPDRSVSRPKTTTAVSGSVIDNDKVPAYLSDTYTWAYLSRAGTALFDRQLVVNTILWGNARRLIRWVTDELQPGWTVLQPAAVYGSYSRDIARHLGADGHLDVTDIAPIQVSLTRRKLADIPQAVVARCDATTADRGPYDAVTCFFLLHEVPETVKAEIVNAMLDAVRPGGKVVFVDYHRPRPWHPMKPIMAMVFRMLEPFATTLWDKQISEYASHRTNVTWRKDTLFGGLYQKVVAVRGT